MKIIYCDAGLVNNTGHHANSCRLITAEFKRRGIPCRVFGHAQCEQSLRDELGVEPQFRVNPYFLSDAGNPISGWLTAFMVATSLTVEDMPRTDDDSIIYWNSGQAAQIMALGLHMQQWSNQSNGFKGPRATVIELGVDPGMDWTGKDYSIRDPRVDARSVLYHYAGEQMKLNLAWSDEDRDKLHITTFEPQATHPYSLLLQRDVTCLPVPRTGRLAKCQKERTYFEHLLEHKRVGFVGHQRGEKGAHLIKEIIEYVQRQRPQTNFLIQSGEDECPWSGEWRTMATGNDRIQLMEGPIGGTDWDNMLDICDLICLPYNDQFRFRYSAVACEAVAAGIPYVCPSSSSMENLSSKSSRQFLEQTPYAIGNAIMHALDDYSFLLAEAAARSQWWAETQGPKNMVDSLLKLCEET
jgi:hypothetical protein